MFTVEITGLEDVGQRVETVLRQLGQAGQHALYQEGVTIMGASHDLVPIDTGLLRMTGFVSNPVMEGTTAMVELRYGAHGMAPYALVVHEDRIPPMNHPRGGHSHFLSEPFFAATDGMLERLAAAIASQLGV